MTEPWIVDRIEEGIAILLRGGESLELAIEALPPGTREGDALTLDPAGALRLDRAASVRARAEARERLERLRRGDPGGDLEA